MARRDAALPRETGKRRIPRTKKSGKGSPTQPNASPAHGKKPARWPMDFPRLQVRLLPPAASAWQPDSYTATVVSDILDRSYHATIARGTAGLSPAALAVAYFDWLIHLSMAPGKRLQLVEKAMRKWARHLNYCMHCASRGDGQHRCIEPLPQDKRFRGDQWHTCPWNLIHQGFLLTQQWWHNATTGVPGMSGQHERVLEFAARQMLDVIAPSNFLTTNPEVIEKTLSEGGANLVRGYQNLVEDWERATGGYGPVGAERYRPGQEVAVTPGKVIYRNRLIELIQYLPVTEQVRPEPVLIVPAWIMKYYILDLSPQNSLVKYLTEKGFTVFIISWKNPGPEDRDLTMDDYRRLGVIAALDAIRTVVPERRIHGVGYCLGGTLLAIAASALARDGDDRLQTLSLLATQIDFTEIGELQLFISESQLKFLEDMMWEQGFLDTKQMAGAFQLLRSNDLIWSRMVHDYLMGERRPMNDLMAWNADATRMPYAMHAEYLRRFFLNNDLAEGRYRVDDRPVAISDIRVAVFSVGTAKDHVAPWRSVYKVHLLTDTDVTFLLTSGGHNAGIVSEPGHPGRSYQVSTKDDTDRFMDPDTWAMETSRKDGSWWPEWIGWLKKRSGKPIKPCAMGASDKGLGPLCDAPGTYVHQD